MVAPWLLVAAAAAAPRPPLLWLRPDAAIVVAHRGGPRGVGYIVGGEAGIRLTSSLYLVPRFASVRELEGERDPGSSPNASAEWPLHDVALGLRYQWRGSPLEPWVSGAISWGGGDPPPVVHGPAVMGLGTFLQAGLRWAPLDHLGLEVATVASVPIVSDGMPLMFGYLLGVVVSF